MNEAQGAAATGESEGTTPNPTEAGQAQQQGQLTQPTMLGALLEDMDLPKDVLDLVKPKTEVRGQKTEGSEGAEGEEAGEGEAGAIEEPATEEQEPEPAAAQGAPAAGEEDKPVPEEWPQSAKARVAEEADRKRKARVQAEEWEKTARTLHAQLQEAQAQPKAVAGTPQDPLAGVFTPEDLVQAKKQYRELKFFAEDNPEGAFDVLLGKDAQGNEIRRDYSAEDIRHMRRTAELVLEEGVPLKQDYLNQVNAFAREAAQIFPEMFKEGTEMNREAARILEGFPDIRKSPDYLLWLGDAITHRRERMKRAPAGRNGQPLSGQAQAILSQPRMPMAPGVTKTRSVEPTRGGQGSSVDRKSAREELLTSDFSDEARERYIGKILSGSSRKGGKAPTLV